MRTRGFHHLALPLAGLLALVLHWGAGPRADGQGTLLPLFTLLAMAELGALLALGGAWSTAQQWRQGGFRLPLLLALLSGLALAAWLAWRGLGLWPG